MGVLGQEQGLKASVLSCRYQLAELHAQASEKNPNA